MSFPRHIQNLIASFRGLPPDRSRSRLRESKPIADLMAQVVDEYRIGVPSMEETIMRNWDKIVGPSNAGFVNLLKIENERRVLIAVSNPIVRQELFFHRKLILQRIRQLSGCGKIRDLRLLAG